MNITFSSGFYIIKSKFDPYVYVQWMNNFISIVNNFNLVIYTDENSKHYINTNDNDKIKIVIKPLEEFYNYKYKEDWIENHNKNTLLNDNSVWKTDWQLNMLWTEKIWFVKDTIDKKYFETDFYGWCDIGYFRDGVSDYFNWPSNTKINNINKDKIVYGIIDNGENYINNLYEIISNKNEQGLPSMEIPQDQVSISGGFFIIFKEKIDWWANTYNNKLELYFKNKYLVKDDQIILVDCMFTNFEHFSLVLKPDWFMFKQILL